jgi:kojibiose phosphorylase/nigerose phosphorylase
MRTFFRHKQVHITAAVAYGILRYVEWTGDKTILDKDGVRTIIECARFYHSLLLKPVEKDRYEIRDVIGPDEYHERVNNNGYTNRMAKYTLEAAVRVIGEANVEGTLPEGFDADEWKKNFAVAAERLYIPTPSNRPGKEGVIEQFDGYFDLEDTTLDEVRGRLLHEKEYWGGAYGVASHTQIIKQADVVTWLNLFDREYDIQTLRANWDYYEPRTEHGSSLSAGMYAMLACKIGEPDKAYPFFLKSAMADLKGGGKEWAGLVYIGGTHPAAAGAAYMTAIEGFAGVSVVDGELKVRPSLPRSITGMEFNCYCRGVEYKVSIDGGNAEITSVGS